MMLRKLLTCLALSTLLVTSSCVREVKVPTLVQPPNCLIPKIPSPVALNTQLEACGQDAMCVIKELAVYGAAATRSLRAVKACAHNVEVPLEEASK